VHTLGDAAGVTLGGTTTADKSKIEWTDATWNPIRGCSRVSEGCRNCYAERTAARFAGAGQPFEGVAFPIGGRGLDVKLESLANGGKSRGWTGDVHFIPELLELPLRWKRPRKIFVNSMSDLFHEKTDVRWIDQICAVMMVCPQHIFQVLTKRPERMRNYLCNVGARQIEPHMQRLRPGIARLDWPWRNIWWGVSVEDQKTADERIPLLLETPAAVRWVSYEPALAAVNFSNWILQPCRSCGHVHTGQCQFLLQDEHGSYPCLCPASYTYKSQLDWMVAGGESGPGARATHPAWIRAVRDQCYAARVPFFFKQWGEWLNSTQLKPAFTDAELDRAIFKTVRREPDANQPNAGLDDLYFRVSKKRAGRLLDGCEWNQFPGECRTCHGTGRVEAPNAQFTRPCPNCR